MARTKFKSITMEYAGQDLLDGGMLANVDGALSGATRYNVQAVQCLGAAAVELDENGNLEGECSVPVAVDYETEAEMVADVLARQAFCDAHQRGVLRRGIAGADAMAVFTPLDEYTSGMDYELGVYEDGVLVNEWAWGAQDGDTAQELVDALNDDSGQYWQNTRDIEAALEGGKVVLRREGVHGAASNGYSVMPYAMTPFAETDEKPIAGGVDGVEIARAAALSGFNYSSTLGGRGLRVVFEYSFILGAAAGA